MPEDMARGCDAARYALLPFPLRQRCGSQHPVQATAKACGEAVAIELCCAHGAISGVQRLRSNATNIGD